MSKSNEELYNEIAEGTTELFSELQRIAHAIEKLHPEYDDGLGTITHAQREAMALQRPMSRERFIQEVMLRRSDAGVAPNDLYHAAAKLWHAFVANEEQRRA